MPAFKKIQIFSAKFSLKKYAELKNNIVVESLIPK